MRLRTLMEAVLVATGAVAVTLAATQVTSAMPFGVVALLCVLGALVLVPHRRTRLRALAEARVAVAARSAARRSAPAAIAPLTVSRRVRR